MRVRFRMGPAEPTESRTETWPLDPPEPRRAPPPPPTEDTVGMFTAGTPAPPAAPRPPTAVGLTPRSSAAMLGPEREAAPGRAELGADGIWTPPPPPPPAMVGTTGAGAVGRRGITLPPALTVALLSTPGATAVATAVEALEMTRGKSLDDKTLWTPGA